MSIKIRTLKTTIINPPPLNKDVPISFELDTTSGFEIIMKSEINSIPTNQKADRLIE